MLIDVAFLLAAGPNREPLLPLWAMELLASLFLYAWLFCVGACIGSFLNVVVYRLPRRKNLVYPGSMCPRCGHPIRLYDNIPIVSWLVLRGRCRDCRASISPRYFFVEFVVAAIFLVVALVETKLTGGSFPRRHWDAGRWLIAPYETLPFWSTYGLHVILLATLLAAALIDYDGFRTPKRLFASVVALTAILPAIMPPLDRPHAIVREQWRADLTACALGLAGGIAAGAAVGFLWRISSPRAWPRFAPVTVLATMGAIVGAQCGLEVAAVSTSLFAVAVAGLSKWRRRFVFVVPFAGLVLVVCLPRLLALDARLGMPLNWPPKHTSFFVAGGASIVCIASFIAGHCAPAKYFLPPAPDEPTFELEPASSQVMAEEHVTPHEPHA